jgi:hypothetical protein
VGKQAYRLILPENYFGMHVVFHVSQLEPIPDERQGNDRRQKEGPRIRTQGRNNKKDEATP